METTTEIQDNNSLNGKRKIDESENKNEETGKNKSNLVELAYKNVHIDNAEQFLTDSNIRLPCLNKIHIFYGDLVSVAENTSTMRINCAKLKHIIFDEKMAMVQLKDCYLYFRLLL